MTEFTLTYHGGYKVKMKDNVLNIYLPPGTIGKPIDLKISKHIVSYLENEGFFEGIPVGGNISTITHEALN
jgi:hypothetical protein